MKIFIGLHAFALYTPLNSQGLWKIDQSRSEIVRQNKTFNLFYFVQRLC